MELYQIRYFLALCDTLNFARAAERCNVCQPSLTRAIQKLEQELGGLLIRRERKLTHLTELGQLVRPMLDQVLAHAEETKSAARRFMHVERRSLKLGLLSSIGPTRFAPFLAQFCGANQSVELALMEADGAGLRDMLLSGVLDVAVSSRVEPPHDRLRHHRLYLEPLVAIFPLGHRLEQFNAVRLTDLKNETFLLRQNCELRGVVLDTCRKQGFEPRVDLQRVRKEWLQMMIAAGRGVTIMPAYSHLGHATFARPLVDPELAREVSLVTVTGRQHDPWTAALLRAIRAHKWIGETEVVDLDRPVDLPLVYTPSIDVEARRN